MNNKYQEALNKLCNKCFGDEPKKVLQELVDKEKPKKGIKEIVLDAYDCDDRNIDFEYEIIKCPNCNFHLVDETEGWNFEDWDYCPECGQKLDWSDE